MSLSDEWEEVHLTPAGWVDGSYKHDFAKSVDVPVPQDAVLTVFRHVTVGAIGATPKVHEKETPLTTDSNLIAELRAKYGKPTFSC